MSDIDIEFTLENLEHVLSRTGRRLLLRISKGEWGEGRVADDAYELLEARLGLYHPRIVSGECANALAMFEVLLVSGYIPNVEVLRQARRIAMLVRGLRDSLSVRTYFDPVSDWALGLASAFLLRLQGATTGLMPSAADPKHIGLLHEAIALSEEHRARREIKAYRKDLRKYYTDILSRAFLSSMQDLESINLDAKLVLQRRNLLLGLSLDIQFLNVVSDLLGQMSERPNLKAACWCLLSNEFGDHDHIAHLDSLLQCIDEEGGAVGQRRRQRPDDKATGDGSDSAATFRWLGAQICRNVFDESLWVNGRTPSDWKSLRALSESFN